MNTKILQNVCESLNVGRVEVLVDDGATKKHSVVYDHSVYDMSKCSMQKVDNMTFTIYALPDKALESEDKIRLFSQMLVAFVENDNKQAEKTSFYDDNLGVHTIGYFSQTVETLINNLEITMYGACFFNLKSFSIINEKIGREQGTYVMKRFVTQLEELIGKRGCVCRMGGDNFIMLFPKEKIDVVIVYLKGTPVIYDETLGEQIMVSANGGYYMIPNSDIKVSDILDRVSSAVKIAQDNPKELVVFYDDKLQHQKDHIKNMESMFGPAIQNEEFLVYYQPKVKLKKYNLHGAEALCRWMHNGKLIPPNEFIPIFERSNLICNLDFYMLEHVCRDIRQWLDEGKRVVRVSVNLSRRHMGDMNLLDRIVAVIDKYQVPHEYIEIELTETTTDVEFNDMKQLVWGLHEHGIHTAVDDFGIGYSSINLLRQLPWDVIKIDKSFLPDTADRDTEQYQTISQMLNMLKGMGYMCIVEGVETVEHVKILKDNNCFMAQGFYFDRPLPKEEFSNRLEM